MRGEEPGGTTTSDEGLSPTNKPAVRRKRRAAIIKNKTDETTETTPRIHGSGTNSDDEAAFRKNNATGNPADENGSSSEESEHDGINTEDEQQGSNSKIDPIKLPGRRAISPVPSDGNYYFQLEQN